MSGRLRSFGSAVFWISSILPRTWRSAEAIFSIEERAASTERAASSVSTASVRAAIRADTSASCCYILTTSASSSLLATSYKRVLNVESR